MINVTGAIIIHNNKVLIAQRAKGKYMEYRWEFPGGKQEQGETLEECLIREIKEELGKDITIIRPLDNLSWTDSRGDFTFYTFLCTCDDDKIPHHPDHEQCLWINPSDFHKYHFMDGDIPSIKKLQSLGAI